MGVRLRRTRGRFLVNIIIQDRLCRRGTYDNSDVEHGIRDISRSRDHERHDKLSECGAERIR